MSDLTARAHRLRHEVLPAYRDRMDPTPYILLTCDADVAITAAGIDNAKTVARLEDRLHKTFRKLDGVPADDVEAAARCPHECDCGGAA